MKTKEFIERVESNLFTVKESHDGTIIFIHPSRSDFNILAWVNKYENEFHIYSVLPKDLAESLLAYAMTPIEEREEEKKYIYKFPFNVIYETKKDLYIFKILGDGLNLSNASVHDLEINYRYHFTDKEVGKFTGKERALFNACEKIEVL